MLVQAVCRRPVVQVMVTTPASLVAGSSVIFVNRFVDKPAVPGQGAREPSQPSLPMPSPDFVGGQTSASQEMSIIYYSQPYYL